jgi:hypothetical protein
VDAEVASVSVEELPAVTEVGLKLAVAPDGSPEADSATDSVSPPVAAVEIVAVAELPWVTDPEAGLADIEKSEAGGATETVVA